MKEDKQRAIDGLVSHGMCETHEEAVEAIRLAQIIRVEVQRILSERGLKFRSEANG